MKRIILTLCMTMVACITAFAQKALFEKYSETDGVSTVYISRNMMRMMGNVKAGNKDISKIAGRLDYLQILSCERPSLIPSIKKSAQSIFNQQKYSIVMQVNERGEHTTIYERHYPNGKNEFSLLAIERYEITIINLLGNISLQDIQGIAGGK